MKSNQSSGHPPCTCYLWILGKSLILWIGRLCGGFFIIYGIRDKILKVQYQGFTCQVLHRGTTTKPIKVKTGVRQRCLLLLLLFLMVLDWVSKNAYEGKRLGLQWTLTQRQEDLDYADDLCLLTHRLVDMKQKGERLQETGGQVGLKINIKSQHSWRAALL